MNEFLPNLVKSYSNVHQQGAEPNIFLFATPRGGSTWFMEMIWSQKGIKYCSEPFNVRRPLVARDLSISSFAALYSDGSFEKFERYVRKLETNKIRYNNPNPFRKHSNLLTDRIIYKVIHAGMDRISWFEKTFKAQAFVVVRHPIPVSMSRKVFPLLEEFEESNYAKHFTDKQIDLVAKVKAEGDHLSRGVVAWCLHNYFPLFKERGQHLVLSYEEALLKPEGMIELMATTFKLKNREVMLSQSGKPSAVLKLSSKERRRLLSNQSGNRSRLINSWRTQVDITMERKLMRLLAAFDIDAYQVGMDTPTPQYLHTD